jgi:hypothetical protein
MNKNSLSQQVNGCPFLYIAGSMPNIRSKPIAFAMSGCPGKTSGIEPAQQIEQVGSDDSTF